MLQAYVHAEQSVKKPEVDFHRWLEAFSQQASTQGISDQTLAKAFRAVEYDSQVIALDRKQPEFTQSFNAYMSKRLTGLQIKRGKRRLQRYRSLFNSVSKRYQVDPTVVAAIWGIESNFGTYLPTFNAIQTLATLAFDPRRSDFFQNELLAALKILDRGRLKPEWMKGSYSGALGQPQFMPTTYLRFSQDFDKDGFADIWQSKADILASIATYLKQKGHWQYKQPWGVRVSMPPKFEVATLNSQVMPFAAWLEMGLVPNNDTRIQKKWFIKASVLAQEAEAMLLVPERSEGEAFLVLSNFNAVMEYNPSHFYALAVCLLADKLK